jgi:hypothetical protein
MNRNYLLVNITLSFSLVTFCSKETCFGQVLKDTLNIPEYHLNSCISGLFTAVAESNKDSYDSQDYFYSVTFREADSLLYMTISPSRWTRVRHLDYCGIVKLQKTSFLLRGDLDKGGIFKKDQETTLRVPIRKEAVDTSQLLFSDPSLEGRFLLCGPLPIDLEIYTKNQIKGFDMKNKN